MSANASNLSSKFARLAQSLGTSNPFGRISKNTIPLLLSPRRKQPTYLFNSNEQPVDLLPMKVRAADALPCNTRSFLSLFIQVAAFREYPNFFNVSCNFFNSIGRDQQCRRPQSVIRVTSTSLDLAKVLRNLGIISSFQIGQKTNHLSSEEYIWQPEDEPAHAAELKVYKQKFLRLDLRWELYKPIWQLASHSSSLSSTPLAIPGEHLPLSIKNISKASRPVLMMPAQMSQAKERHPSGIFIAYNDKVGITTCAFLEQLQLPGLVMAHLGLPFSHAAQIKAAARHKISSESSLALELMVKLKDWSMVDWVRETIVRRREADVGSMDRVNQIERIKELVGATKRETRLEAAELDTSDELARELVGLSVVQRTPQTRKN